MTLFLIILVGVLFLIVSYRVFTTQSDSKTNAKIACQRSVENGKAINKFYDILTEEARATPSLSLQEKALRITQYQEAKVGLVLCK